MKKLFSLMLVAVLMLGLSASAMAADDTTDIIINVLEDNPITLPFSGSHKKMFDYFGKGFSIEIDSAIEWLNTEPQSLYRDVLIYQLSVNKNLM